MSNWVSIDFGTCNTAAAIIVDGRPHVVTYGNDSHFPTIACVLDDGAIEVCQNAEPLRLTNPETFRQEFKLHIAEDTGIASVTYTDIVAEILSFVRKCAELENNGDPVDKAVITVPAVYTENDARKSVMTEAARAAGFNEVELMSEPEAAAAHYAMISGSKNTGLSLIYDLGGGTFDPALLEMTQQGAKLPGHDSGVKSGGAFFDKAVYTLIAEQAKACGSPLTRGGRLSDYAACRRLKETLSVRDEATAVFSNGKRHTLSRSEFERQIKPMIDLTLSSCDNLLATARHRWSDLSRILLVGGSTAIPCISEALSAHLTACGATSVRIIRNTSGPNGSYDHRFATCLGGITSKINGSRPTAEKPARLVDKVSGISYQLKLGENSFGRGEQVDFRFDDPCMSRLHFSIDVTAETDGRLNYMLTTRSRSGATILNNIEALDLRYAPIARINAFLSDGATVTAGKTILKLEKQKTS